MNNQLRFNKLLVQLIAIVFFLVMLATAAWAFTGGGNGVSGDAYEISTPEQLDSIRDNLGAHYILVDNIDLTAYMGGQGWTPIGPFTGSFDGGGFTISNLYINMAGLPDAALFSSSSGNIQNITLENVAVTGGSYVGGLVARNTGTMTNCNTSGTTQGQTNVGGLVGRNYGTIINSHTSGDVIGSDMDESLINNLNVGGLVGTNDGTIEDSQSSTDVTTDDNFVGIGGLVGSNSGDITESHASGSVSAGNGSNYVGGLVGENFTGTVTYSYATGTVTGGENSSYFGGLVGNSSGTVADSYTTNNVTTGTFSFATGGLVGRTTDDAIITRSYVTGTVIAHDDVGGLVGQNNGDAVENSYSMGSVNGANDIGGLVGTNYGIVDSSYSVSTVQGEEGVGGLLGYNDGTATVANSYAVGAVTGTAKVGGLAGENFSGGTITASAYNNETTGQTIGVGSGDASGVTGLSIVQMKQESTFQTDFGIWDFGASGDWIIAVGTYPYLQWQSDNTDFAPPIFNEGYPQADNVTYNEADLYIQVDEVSIAYYKVLTAGASAPSAAAVKGNADGNIALQADTDGVGNITELDAETAYMIYVVVEDVAGNLQLTAKSVGITTLADSNGETPVAGEVYSFGSNSQGQLGLGYDGGIVDTPTLINGLSGVKAVAAGVEHSLVLVEKGDVYSFGEGYLGQLGPRPGAFEYNPAKIEGIPGPVKAIAAGYSHSLVLLENGDVYSFGGGGFGQLGHGDTPNSRTVPTKIEALSGIKIKAISSTNFHSLVLSEAGEVYSFGAGGGGQLGLGDELNRNTPIKITGLSNVEAIAAGGSHSLVLLEDGSVYSFGDGSAGKLGHGDINNKLIPTQITALPDLKAKAIAAGASHSLVLLENGDVYSFGFGTKGRLGHGDEDSTFIPIKIDALSGVQSISGGGEHTLALLENGSVYAFGDNEEGQLGLGDVVNSLTPARISGLSDVAAISAGGEHSLIVVGSVDTTPPDEDDDDDGGSSGSSGSGTSITPPDNSLTITPDQVEQHLNNNQWISYEFSDMNLSIDPEALPGESWETIEVEASVVTDPDTLNTFFLAYPNQKGIMKGYNVTFTSQNNGETENITQLNRDITITFQLSEEELAGIDPSTLIIYKQGEDGSITEYSGEFDWEQSSISFNTNHLCQFFVMGQEGIPTQRLAGDNRYATAAAISSQGWEASDNVFLASGENFPDALAGTALAGFLDSPVLLTASNNLSSEALQEIRRLKAKNIYILGGTSVVSEVIENQLAQNYTVTRLSGSDRYETAIEIGEFIKESKDSIGDSTMVTDTVILATGSNYPDALSVAPFAGQNAFPILFTQKDGLNTSTRKALSDWGIKKVILIGGKGVISEKVEDLLKSEMQITVTRLAGEDRYLTSLEIAKYFARNGSYNYAALATGENYPDALSGASLAAKGQYPVLLVKKADVTEEVELYLKDLNLERLYIYGGKAIITDKVREVIN